MIIAMRQPMSGRTRFPTLSSPDAPLTPVLMVMALTKTERVPFQNHVSPEDPPYLDLHTVLVQSQDPT